MIAIHERVESLRRSPGILTDDPADDAFVSSVPFEADRIGAAAIYCSDGRYGDQMDEFLHLGLGFPRYDRFAVPGGAACLADHIQALRERSALERQLRFLIEAHELNQIVLVAHQECAFYRSVRWRAASLEQQQFADLARAAERIREFGAGDQHRGIHRPPGEWTGAVRCGAETGIAGRTVNRFATDATGLTR